MQFLRTVFWVVIAVLGVIFAFNNWIDVRVHLWSDIEAVWKLPFLLLAVFLLGLMPPWILHRFTRWSFRRKLETANRNLIETRTSGDVGTTGFGIDPVPDATAPVAPVNSAAVVVPTTLL